MRRVILLVLIFVVGLVMFYLSRFWGFNLWPRGGLFGLEALRPDGGLLARWLRGTSLAPFELLIWITGVFLILTYLQRFIDFVFPAQKDENHDQ